MSYDHEKPIPGRGAQANPKNRFETTHYAADPDPQPPPEMSGANGDAFIDEGAGRRHPLTQYIPDATQSIIATNTSPDIPFKASINPYRGCSHGCIYCFARPGHEYLGMSAGLDFETKIMVKHDAPALLRKELSARRWVPQMIACSGVTDCYQPVERRLQLTRRCLEVLLDFRNPVGIVTKNHLVTRDIDLLRELAAFDCAQVFVSITTLDAKLTQIMEPRTSVPRDRLRTVRELHAVGIPVGVMVAPVIPGLTDHEMPKILEAARDAGASSAGFVPLRLPLVLKELFKQWLAEHFPNRQEKILNRITDIQGGKLYNPAAFERMSGQGQWADLLADTFSLHTARLGLNLDRYQLSTAHFRVPPQPGDQGSLF